MVSMKWTRLWVFIPQNANALKFKHEFEANRIFKMEIINQSAWPMSADKQKRLTTQSFSIDF